MRLENIADFAMRYWTFSNHKGIDVKLKTKDDASLLERSAWKTHCGLPVIKAKVRVIEIDDKKCQCDKCQNADGTWQDMWICSYNDCTYADHPSGYAGGM